MTKCTHTESVSGGWVDNYCVNWDGEIENDPIYEEGWDKPTTVDIDLHRYKCTQCDEIMYYSNKARKFYEEGIGEL